MKKLLIITLLLVAGLNAHAYTEGLGLRFVPNFSNNWNDGRNWIDTVYWLPGLVDEDPTEFDDAIIPEHDVVANSIDLIAETGVVGTWYTPDTPYDGVASLTLEDGAGLRIKMQTGSTRRLPAEPNSPPSPYSPTGVLFLGETEDLNIPSGDPSGTLTINGGRMDVDHCLVLGAENDAGGLLEMNGGELWVGFNPQDSGTPYLYTPGETFGAAIAVGGIGHGHIEISGGTIHTKSLSLDPIDPNSDGGTTHFAGIGGTIIIECADPTAAGAVEGSINGYITSGAMTNAVAIVNGNNVEITGLCDYPVGDFNYDCVVNFIDFAMLAAQWQQDGF